MTTKIKFILLGVLIGISLSVPIVWAATRIVLINGGGVEYSSSSPLYIQTNQGGINEKTIYFFSNDIINNILLCC